MAQPSKPSAIRRFHGRTYGTRERTGEAPQVLAGSVNAPKVVSRPFQEESSVHFLTGRRSPALT